MKRTILIAITALISVNVWGQWTGTNPVWTNSNVGIGTDDPEVKFHIKVNNIGIKSGYAKSIIEATDAQLDITSSSDGIWGSAINLIEGNGLTNTDIWSVVRQTTGGTGNSSLHFNYGIINNHTNSTKMALDKNGNVGIGTSDPQRALHIVSSEPKIYLEGISTVDPTINFRMNGTQYGVAGWDIGDNVMKLKSGSMTGSNGINIDNNNNVGIGTTNPSSKLHVVGAAEIAESNVSAILGNAYNYWTYFGGTSGGRIRGSDEGYIVIDGNPNGSGNKNIYLNSGTSSDVIIAKGGGNVGIGNISPSDERSLLE